MFCHKKDMALVNRLHKRALRTVYDNFTLNFEELLHLDNSCTIHTKHLRILMTEIYKSTNRDNPELMWDVFSTKNIPYGQ